jgi:hypothetical protein
MSRRLAGDWPDADITSSVMPAQSTRDGRAMSDTDIFREVEEDLQRERYEKLWKKYGATILAAVGLIVIGFGLYQLWQWRERSLAEAMGTKLIAASDLARDGKAEDARTALTALAAEAPASYRVLAQLKLAGADAKAGKLDEAAKAYDTIGKDSTVDKPIREFAQIQAATLRVDQADWTEMQNRLTPFADVGNGWRHAARELLGLSAMKAGKSDDAESQFQLILSDRASPSGLSQRAQMMLDVLLAGSPKPAPATPAAKPADVTKTDKTN